MPLGAVGSSTEHGYPIFHDPMDTRSYVLKVIKETLIGERLLKALQVYGRSCAVISIDPIGTENRAYSFTVAGGT